ncbi:MAG: hypothetical protein M1831_004151 [Alyxoria varia]|nr:MAG: hypothetical protein M1831_004151 [Alyxoria varia]
MSTNGPKGTTTTSQQTYTLPPATQTDASLNPSPLARFAARQPEHRINTFSGGVAGVASGIVTCPLDVIKTKLQGQGGFRPRSTFRTAAASSSIPNNGNGHQHAAPSYRGLFGTASVIWKQDGLRGMYRGLSPMLLGYLPTWAVYMTVYGSSRDYLYTQTDNKWLAQMCASLTAGASSSLVTNPIWVIKTRLMSQVGVNASKDHQPPWHYNGTLDAARKMFRAEGIQSFYSGLGPALLGLTHVAIQFPLYEYCKLRFTGVEMGQQVAGDTREQGNHTLGVLAATFVSKVCATTATYPHEVLRTRLQTQQRRRAVLEHQRNSMRDPSAVGHITSRAGETSSSSASSQKPAEIPRYTGILATCRTILREEGWRAFYYGMGTNLVRAVPAAMTTMLTFETVKQGILGLQKEGRVGREGDVE